MVEFVTSPNQSDIIKRLDNEELRRILRLPHEIGEHFFQSITVSDKKAFVSRKKSEINFSAFFKNRYWDISLAKLCHFENYSELTNVKSG